MDQNELKRLVGKAALNYVKGNRASESPDASLISPSTCFSALFDTKPLPPNPASISGKEDTAPAASSPLFTASFSYSDGFKIN